MVLLLVTWSLVWILKHEMGFKSKPVSICLPKQKYTLVIFIQFLQS